MIARLDLTTRKFFPYREFFYIGGPATAAARTHTHPPPELLMAPSDGITRRGAQSLQRVALVPLLLFIADHFLSILASTSFRRCTKVCTSWNEL